MGLTPISANQGYLVPKPPSGRATLLSRMKSVCGSAGSFWNCSFMSSKLALAAPQPEDSTAFVSPEWSCKARLMPHGPVKKLTCSRSSPVLYGGALNIPWKKSSFPLPSGCVELPTTIRAARSTRGAEIEAGWVAATPATVVATPTAAMPSAALLTRFVAALLIPHLSPESGLQPIASRGARRGFQSQESARASVKRAQSVAARPERFHVQPGGTSPDSGRYQNGSFGSPVVGLSKSSVPEAVWATSWPSPTRTQPAVQSCITMASEPPCTTRHFHAVWMTCWSASIASRSPTVQCSVRVALSQVS